MPRRRYWGLTGTIACCAVLITGCTTPRQAVALPPHPVVTAVLPAKPLHLPAGAQAVHPYVEPDDSKRVISQAILHARSSLLLEMYLLTDRVLLHDLEHAAAKGVAVQVILERQPYASDGSNANIYAYNNLLAAEIPTHWSSTAFLLTHAKTMVVNGRAAYIMTTNYSRSAFRSNREFIAVNNDPVDVRQVTAIFMADWTSRLIIPTDPRVPVSPTDARSLLEDLLTSAHSTLELYAEEFQDPRIADLLARQARKGVRVRLLLPYQSGSGLLPDAADVALLRQAGGIVQRMGSPNDLYIHAKVVIADGREAFVGSENWSSASLDGNREVGLFIADSAAIARLQATFEHDWRNNSAP